MKQEKGKIDTQKFWKIKKRLFPQIKQLKFVPWRYTQKGLNPIRLRII